MSTPITEAHRKLACDVLLDHSVSGAATKDGVIAAAQWIADSEARACEQLRADCDYNHECINRLASSTGTLGEKSEKVVELATERARLDDLVADLNDACITLASAKDDCDDYALLNTGFKLTAVRDVLIQYIPNTAMKEGSK